MAARWQELGRHLLLLRCGEGDAAAVRRARWSVGSPLAWWVAAAATSVGVEEMEGFRRARDLGFGCCVRFGFLFDDEETSG